MDPSTLQLHTGFSLGPVDSRECSGAFGSTWAEPSTPGFLNPPMSTRTSSDAAAMNLRFGIPLAQWRGTDRKPSPGT